MITPPNKKSPLNDETMRLKRQSGSPTRIAGGLGINSGGGGSMLPPPQGGDRGLRTLPGNKPSVAPNALAGTKGGYQGKTFNGQPVDPGYRQAPQQQQQWGGDRETSTLGGGTFTNRGGWTSANAPGTGAMGGSPIQRGLHQGAANIGGQSTSPILNTFRQAQAQAQQANGGQTSRGLAPGNGGGGGGTQDGGGQSSLQDYVNAGFTNSDGTPIDHIPVDANGNPIPLNVDSNDPNGNSIHNGAGDQNGLDQFTSPQAIADQTGTPVQTIIDAQRDGWSVVIGHDGNPYWRNKDGKTADWDDPTGPLNNHRLAEKGRQEENDFAKQNAADLDATLAKNAAATSASYARDSARAIRAAMEMQAYGGGGADAGAGTVGDIASQSSVAKHAEIAKTNLAVQLQNKQNEFQRAMAAKQFEYAGQLQRQMAQLQAQAVKQQYEMQNQIGLKDIFGGLLNVGTAGLSAGLYGHFSRGE